MTILDPDPIHLTLGNAAYKESHKNAFLTMLFLESPILWKNLSHYEKNL